VKTCILKHDVPNPMSLTTRYLDFKTLHYCFGHAFDEVMYHVLNNVGRSVFKYGNVSTVVVLLKKYTNPVFLRTLFTPVSL